MFTKKDFIYIAVIAILGIFLLRSTSCSPDPNTATVKPVLKPVVQKQDKKGTIYTEIKGTLYTESQMSSITDSLMKVLGKGKVLMVTQTITKVDTKYIVKNMYIDTLSGDIYAADSNKNSRISYAGNLRTKEGVFSLHLIPDTATSITAVKNPLIGRSTMTTNIYHTNELFNPSEGYSYSTKAPRTIATLGPVVGAGYTTGIAGIRGFAGVGVTLNILSIKSRK